MSTSTTARQEITDRMEALEMAFSLAARQAYNCLANGDDEKAIGCILAIGRETHEYEDLDMAARGLDRTAEDHERMRTLPIGAPGSRGLAMH